MEKTKYLRQGAAHLLIWGFLCALPFLFNPNEEISERAWLRNMAPLLFSAFIFYLNYFFLIDKLLFKNRTTLFLAFNFLLLILCMYGFEEVRQQIPHTDEGHRLPPPTWQVQPKKPKAFGKWFMLVRTSLSFLLTAGISVAIRSTQKLQKMEKEKQNLENEQLKSELANLKYQLQPHFFFNALNNIYSLMDSAPSKAKESIHGLAKLMRHILYETQDDRIPLSKEIEFLESCVKLMKLRLTEQVSLTVEFPKQPPAFNIAPLMLIPLVENAFKHGVSTVIPTRILIRLTIEGGTLHLVTENTYLKKPQTDHSVSGIGISNLKKRLALLYPNRHSFEQKIVEGEEKIVGELYRSELTLAL